MNKVIVITGASRGIGAATARLAAAGGYYVCVNYHKSQTAAQAVVDRIEAAGGKALAVAADISLEADVKKLFSIVDEEMGPITALVNNAGILERQMRVEDMDAARLNRILAVNVVGSFLCASQGVSIASRTLCQ